MIALLPAQAVHRKTQAVKTDRPIRTGEKMPALRLMILCTALLGGCSTYMVAPKVLPPVKEQVSVSLSAVSLIVVNAEKYAAEQDILTVDKGRSGFRANRQAWSMRLVESLSRELAVRGAHVRSDAPVVLSLAVPEIAFSETRGRFQFTVRAVVSSSGGWAKEYEGVAASRATSTGSVQAEADRLAGQALADVIRKMLGDAAFLVHLGSRP
jgi:hypothetical protein